MLFQADWPCQPRRVLLLSGQCESGLMRFFCVPQLMVMVSTSVSVVCPSLWRKGIETCSWSDEFLLDYYMFVVLMPKSSNWWFEIWNLDSRFSLTIVWQPSKSCAQKKKMMVWVSLFSYNLNNIQTKRISSTSSSNHVVMFKASYSMSVRRDVPSGISHGRYLNWNKVVQEATRTQENLHHSTKSCQ